MLFSIRCESTSMTGTLINRLRELQKVIRESGLGGTVLSLPSPKLLMLPSPQSQDVKEETLFSQLVVEPEIVAVSRDLFESGFFNQAVGEAFKALDHFIRKKSGIKKQSGASLMNNAFSPNSPKMFWSDRNTTSQEDEQKGYHLIFSGSFTGVRNPVSHENNWIEDHREALDVILLAQHLLRKAKAAQITELV